MKYAIGLWIFYQLGGTHLLRPLSSVLTLSPPFVKGQMERMWMELRSFEMRRHYSTRASLGKWRIQGWIPSKIFVIHFKATTISSMVFLKRVDGFLFQQYNSWFKWGSPKGGYQGGRRTLLSLPTKECNIALWLTRSSTNYRFPGHGGERVTARDTEFVKVTL